MSEEEIVIVKKPPEDKTAESSKLNRSPEAASEAVAGRIERFSYAC
jgi:hypothetical protein